MKKKESSTKTGDSVPTEYWPGPSCSKAGWWYPFDKSLCSGSCKY